MVNGADCGANKTKIGNSDQTATLIRERLKPFSWLTTDNQSAGFNSTSPGGIRIDWCPEYMLQCVNIKSSITHNCVRLNLLLQS